MEKMKKLIEPKVIIGTTITTFVTGILTSLFNMLPINKIYLYVSFCLFLVAISLDIIQILVAVLKNQYMLEDIMFREKNIYLPDNNDVATRTLGDILNNEKEDYVDKISKVLIICYGTSGYNEIIDKINEGVFKQKIDLDVMFCHPDKVYEGSTHDKNQIIDRIKTYSENSKIKIYLSKEIFTYRGCLVYDNKDKVIWSCLQTYCFSNESNLFYSAKYRNSYSIVGDLKYNDYLISNQKIIEKVFNDLKQEYKGEYTQQIDNK